MMNNENRYLFKFAWKSIRRHSGRSFFIGFSVSLAVVIAVWVVAFFDGMNAQIEKAVVNTNTGFFQIQEPLYSKSTDSSAPRVYTEELNKILSASPVSALSPELVLDANISTPEGSAGLLVLGIDPEKHQHFLPIAKKIKAGEFLRKDNNDYGVVIGKELARVFNFNVGDQLVVNYQDKNGELRSELLSIVGIYHYNSRSFEKKFVYVTQRTWQNLFLNEDTGQILFNRISIMTPDLDAASIINERVKNSGLIVKTWKQLNPEMAVVLDFHDGMIRFFFLIIGVTVTMTILTPVRMLWQERFKEIRMMNIVGVTIKKFWKIGIYEIFMMTGLSALFSSLLLITVIGYQSWSGVDFRFLNREGVNIERAGIKLPGIIYPKLTVEQLIITFAFVVFVLSLSYLWSIHRTLKNLEVEQ